MVSVKRYFAMAINAGAMFGHNLERSQKMLGAIAIRTRTCSITGTSFRINPIRDERLVLNFSNAQITGTDSEKSQQEKSRRQSVRESDCSCNALSTLSSATKLDGASDAIIAPHFAARQPRWGVPRKTTPTVDSAIGRYSERCLDADTIACSKGQLKVSIPMITTNLLNDIAPKTMTNKD